MQAFGIEITPFGVAACAGLALACALATLTWGRKTARKGDWLAGAGLFCAFAIAALGAVVCSDKGVQPVSWLRGWIWTREGQGPVRVGFWLDSTGFGVAAGILALCLALLANRKAIADEKRPDRLYAAIGLGAVGALLSWTSATPWLGLFGIAASSLAGFLCLGSRWDSPVEAALASRYLRERAWGLALSATGAFVLAASGIELAWTGPTIPWAATGSALFGGWLLVAGALCQLQFFPLLGWSSLPSATPPAFRNVIATGLPAISAFALLFRLEPQLRALGIFPELGYIALASAFLSAVTGLFQSEWKLCLNAWLASAFALSVAALSLATAASGLALAVSAFMAGSALAIFGTCWELTPSEPGTQVAAAGRAGWVRAGTFAAAASGTGLLGAVSCGGYVSWLARDLGDAGMTAAACLALVAAFIVAWKAAWLASSGRNQAPAPASLAATGYLALVLSLGALWTGTVTGGAVFGRPDQFFATPLTELFALASGGVQEGDFVTATSMLAGVFFAAVFVAYWTTGRRESAWSKLEASMPRATRFARGGFGVDTAFEHVIRGVASAASLGNEYLDKRAWDRWLPIAFFRSAELASDVVARADRTLVARIDGGIRRSVEVPGKLLQLVQNGNLQWYLFFAIGSGMAMLIHFLRFR